MIKRIGMFKIATDNLLLGIGSKAHLYQNYRILDFVFRFFMISTVVILSV